MTRPNPTRSTKTMRNRVGMSAALISRPAAAGQEVRRGNQDIRRGRCSAKMHAVAIFPANGEIPEVRRPGREAPTTRATDLTANQHEHDVPMACGYGNFADDRIRGRRMKLALSRRWACNFAIPLHSRLRGEGRGEGFVRLRACSPL